MKYLESVSLRWLYENEVHTGMAAIRNLWRKGHIFGHDEKLFSWQFKHGKSSGQIGFLIAETKNEIVAMCGLILMPFHYYGKALIGATGSMNFVKPEWRGRALGLKVLDELDRDVDIMDSVGITQRIATLFRLQKRHVIDTFPRIVCIGSDDAFGVYMQKAEYDQNIRATARQICSRLRKIPAEPGVKLECLSENNLEEWDEAWNFQFAPVLLGAAKNGSYLRWRYLEHPWFKYHGMLSRNRQGQVSGIAIWRIIELPKDICALRILEFLPLDDSSGKALASAIACSVPDNCAFIEHSALGRRGTTLAYIGLSANGSNLISVYTNPPDKDHCKLLSAFKVNEAHVSLSARAFVENRDVYLTLGDTDQDRPNIDMEQ